jgi:hypothetical protein
MTTSFASSSSSKLRAVDCISCHDSVWILYFFFPQHHRFSLWLHDSLILWQRTVFIFCNCEIHQPNRPIPLKNFTNWIGISWIIWKDSLTDWLIDSLIGWLIDFWLPWLTTWFMDWVIDWFSVSWIDWVFDSLIHWFIKACWVPWWIALFTDWLTVSFVD